MIVLLSMILGIDVLPVNSASVVIDTVRQKTEVGTLQPRTHLLSFEESFVAQGSYSGIVVSFRSKERGKDYYELTLFIPSHREFSVGYDSSKGEHTSDIPKTPFTFRAEHTIEMKDRFGRSRPMKVEFSHWQKIEKQHWSQRSIEFKACEIKVESFFIKNHTLTFSGSFECSPDQPEHRASGRFTVDEGDIGVSKVD